MTTRGPDAPMPEGFPRCVANPIFTGLRSSEMLHEELAAPCEESNPTTVSRVISPGPFSTTTHPCESLDTSVQRETRADGTHELKGSYVGLRNEDLVVEVERNASTQPLVVGGDEDRPVHESGN